jgi:Plant ATP synthase F0
MPQLDALTYFTQYVYLVITFVGVYIFVLNFIMPQVISILKLRQKLNSLDLLNNKLNQPSMQVYDGSKLKPLFTQYDQLIDNNWKLSTSKQTERMVQSARVMQFCTTLRLKKLFCHNIIGKLH